MWIRSVFSAVRSPSRAQWLVSVLIAVIVGWIALYVTRPPASSPSASSATGIDTPGAPDPIQSSEVHTILVPDAIPAVDHPKFVAANRAGLRDNMPVIGVELHGEAHAYPIPFMSQVEIVNDRLGGTNIAATW